MLYPHSIRHCTNELLILDVVRMYSPILKQILPADFAKMGLSVEGGGGGGRQKKQFSRNYI